MAEQDTGFIGMPDTPEKNLDLAAELYEQAARATRLAAKCECDGDAPAATEQAGDAETLARTALGLSSNASQVPGGADPAKTDPVIPPPIVPGMLTCLGGSQEDA